MWMFFGSYSDTDAARQLREDIEGALGGLSDKEIAAVLDVPQSSLSNMRAGMTAGPGILRFAQLPAKFWIRFILLRGYRCGVAVLEDTGRKRMAKAQLPLTIKTERTA